MKNFKKILVFITLLSINFAPLFASKTAFQVFAKRAISNSGTKIKNTATSMSYVTLMTIYNAIIVSGVTLLNNMISPKHQTTKNSICWPSSIINKLICEIQASIASQQEDKNSSLYWISSKINTLLWKIKISSAMKQATNQIKQATDLTQEQKSMIINAYQKLNWYDIFIHRKNDSLKEVPYVNISDALLMKYFPLGIWINEQHDTFNKCSNRNLSSLDERIADKCSGFLKNRANKPMLTLTEQLLVNLAAHHTPLGQHAIIAEHYNHFGPPSRVDCEDYYYNAGFAGDLLKSKIIQQVSQVEKSLNAQGFETFFHGRSWEWNFVNDMYNIVHQIKNLPPSTNNIQLRFRDTKTCDIKQLQKYRAELIQNGASYHFHTGTDKNGKEAEITCMNITPVSNSGWRGECTGTYFLDNKSCGDDNAIWLHIEKIFYQHDLSSWYHDHKSDIKKLYKQHKQSNQFGELLCIAVKKNNVDQMIYPAKSGGLKVPGLASEHIQNCKKDALANKEFLDKNRIFYCLAVSDIPGEYGTKYQIQSIHLADPEKYEAYKKSRDAFAKTITTH